MLVNYLYYSDGTITGDLNQNVCLKWKKIIKGSKNVQFIWIAVHHDGHALHTNYLLWKTDHTSKNLKLLIYIYILIVF